MTVLDIEVRFSHLNELIYCLEARFPAPVTIAMLALIDDPTLLPLAVEAWDEWGDTSGAFIVAVRNITGIECSLCDDCADVAWVVTAVGDDDRVCDECLDNYTKCSDCGAWTTETTTVSGDNEVCGGCLEASYTSCDHCRGWTSDGRTSVDRGHGDVCDGCLEDFSQCYRCDRYFSATTTVQSREYCPRCIEADFTWCDECDQYYPDEDEHGGHDEVCGCEAPHPSFLFPANGHGTIEQNERLTVELPQGTIDEEGLARIRSLLYEAICTDIYVDINKIVDRVGPLWQAKRGNFTRRLSNAFFKDHGIKIPTEVISEIGNVARAHSSAGPSTFYVEFTRDLNQSAEAFYHEESCWFTGGSYGNSRCCLKSWGGLAMRTYYDMDVWSSNPIGRIFIQPLNRDLQPTHEVLDAHAFLVFNAYGNLSGYIAARIVAYFTGKTYRKVEYVAENQYINCGGVLVADEATCEATSSIRFAYDIHDARDAHSYMRAAA